MRFATRHRRPPAPPEHGVMPMINIAFLLLVHLLLAGHLAGLDPFPINPPKTKAEGQADSVGALILVNQNGRLALDGADISRDELLAAMRRRAAAESGFNLRIKADGGSEALQILEVLSIAREAGVGSIQLLALPGRE